MSAYLMSEKPGGNTAPGSSTVAGGMGTAVAVGVAVGMGVLVAASVGVWRGNGVARGLVGAAVMAGKPLSSFGLAERHLDHIAVKEAVFPFARFPGVDPILGRPFREEEVERSVHACLSMGRRAR